MSSLDRGSGADEPRQLPEGLITFMFTDIEGSTRLLRASGDRYASLLSVHNRLIRSAVAHHHGNEVRTEGDSFFCVFCDASEALAACLEAQLALMAYPWPEGARLTVRMGIHTGEGEVAERDYIGLAVHQAARVVDAGHGGQVLVSDATRVAIGDAMPAQASLKGLGSYRLKDFHVPTPLYQLCHPNLPAEFPALRTLPAAAHNIPEQATLFVDRRTEVAEIADLVMSVRLVSILGPGGVGKTRLATELVPTVVGSFPDGVWLVELASLSSARAVAPEVATILGVRAEADRSVVETLTEALADKHLLLILDNCEHVLDATAGLVDCLIAGSPGVNVLATTREPLGLHGETRFALMPLHVPKSTDAIDQDAADAVTLFADRARAATRTFDLVREGAAVVEICRRLDGLPLAIELAAARTASIPAGRIAARLDRRFSVVGQAYRGALPHHETLRGSIAWSYDLLQEHEKVLLRRLATFSGEFDMEAAEAICGRAPLDLEDVLDLLSRLVEKSLVQQSGDRYVLLESIREFAKEQLQSAGEADDIAEAHLEYFTYLVEDAARDAEGPNQGAAYDRLDADFANIRAAADRAIASASAAALKLGAGLFQYGFVRNRLIEVARWCIEAVTAVPDAPAELKARSLTQAGSALVVMGSQERGQRFVDDGLVLAREGGDARLLVESLLMAADMRLEAGQSDDAKPLAHEALELVRDLDDDRMLGQALAITARADRDLAGYEETHRQLAQALGLFERCRDRRQVGRVLLTMAYLSLEAGENDVADAEASRCVAVAEALGHAIGRGVAEVVRVWVAIDRADLRSARELLQDTMATARDSGYRTLLAYGVAASAALCAADADYVAAARLLRALDPQSSSLGGEGARAIRTRVAQLRAQLETALGADAFMRLMTEDGPTLDQIAAAASTS